MKPEQKWPTFCRRRVRMHFFGFFFFKFLHSFYLGPVLAFWYCHCLCLSICLYVHQPDRLEVQRLSSLLFWEAIPNSHDYLDCFMILSVLWSPSSAYTYIPRLLHGLNLSQSEPSACILIWATDGISAFNIALVNYGSNWQFVIICSGSGLVLKRPQAIIWMAMMTQLTATWMHHKYLKVFVNPMVWYLAWAIWNN